VSGAGDPPPGELYARNNTRLIDTRAMPWEDHPEIGRIKVLARFETGEPSVFLLWLPPGAAAGDGRPHRHYHRTVAEHHFVLEGEQPTWVYDDAGQGEGEGHPFLLRPGHYLGREPGPEGLHGREPAATSPTGCVMLVWRSGVGNFVREASAAGETVDIPYP
jgi:mannose-6-phosphate isomerase-like protein (cupin superfamily)